MDIPNLTPTANPSHSTSSFLIIFIILALGLMTGFWSSRFFPSHSKTSISNGNSLSNATLVSPPSDSQSIKIGQIYGNTDKNFKDSATGKLEKGSINGEGTHILVRPGGKSQQASLTSSTLDLDLFVGRQVEVKGETNASNKTSWLLDVGTIKVLE
jgi:hypothetical protein